jgi:drug/metabolite transporter (DMT)-like permease
VTGVAGSDPRQVARAELAMLLVVLVWGANFSFMRMALAEMSGLAFAALRFGIAAVILLAVLRWREGSVAVPRTAWWPLIWMGVLSNTLYQVFFMYGLTHTSVANASLIIATTPLIVAFLGAATGVEALRRPIVTGGLLGFAGVVLILAGKGASLGVGQLGGDAAILGATLCWAIFTLGVRAFRVPISTLRLTTWTMVTGAPGLLLLGAPGLAAVDWPGLSPRALTGVGYSCLLAIVVAYMLWNNAVRLVGSGRTSIYNSMIPLVAMLVAWPLLGEVPRPIQVGGAALIIGGVILSRRADPATRPVRTAVSLPG